jgi:methyl-accepting chemotaxis protein
MATQKKKTSAKKSSSSPRRNDQAKLAAIDRAQATIEFTLDGKVVDVNQNFCAALGYTREELIGQHHRLFCAPEWVASPDYQRFWEKLGRGEADAAVYRRLGKGGKEVWIQASYNPLFDSKGKPYGVLKFATDITAARNAQAETEARLKAVDRVQAVIEFALDGTVLHANENFLKVLGYTLDEVKGRPHRIFCDPEWVASHEYREFWARLNRGEFDAGTYRRLGKGGKEVWIEASYNPVFDANGKPVKVVKFASDVTTSRQAALENEARMAAIHKVQAIIEFSPDGTVLDANENFLKTLGYGLDEIKGKHHRMFCEPGYTTSPEYPAFWAKLARGEFDAGVYKRLGRGGREVWIQASYNPVFDSRGKVAKVIKLATDITDQMMVQNIEKLVARASAGELQHRVDATALKGTALALATSINQLLDAVVAPIAETQRVMKRVAQGDVTVRMEGEFAGEFRVLQDAINQSVSQLEETVVGMAQASTAIAAASRDIADGNANLSQRTQEQASSLEETASSIEEMTATVKQNASNATQGSQLAVSARASAEKGNEVVSRAITAMTAITERSKRMADIIGVIEQIAFQTNMLALNAAVEAARAGDQGRGFAVVASEVRNLAQRSATAAREIQTLIKDSSEKVEQGATLVNNSGEVLAEIMTGVKKVADIVGEISAASEEQARGIEQINTAVMQMDKMTQQNAALVEESSSAATAMRDQSEAMTKIVATFKLGEVREAPAPRAPAPVKSAAPAKPKPAARPVVPAAAMKPSSAQDSEWEHF